jgi:hypothetical protein
VVPCVYLLLAQSEREARALLRLLNAGPQMPEAEPLPTELDVGGGRPPRPSGRAPATRRCRGERRGGVPGRFGYQGRYHRPRCATRSHDLGGGPVLGAPFPWGRTGDVRPSLAHSYDTSSVDRDRDGRPSRCKAGRIVPPHLWAFEAKQRRSPTAIRMRATLAVSDRLPVYLLPWIYVRRSLYAVPRHRTSHRDRRTAIPVHITQTAVPVDLQQNALALSQATARRSLCISAAECLTDGPSDQRGASWISPASPLQGRVPGSGGIGWV